ncbi:MAG: hypothetical protein IPM92_12895 [Saprospiraceae bacterium]|nr:hypothetical protein [Saprospiraceae bacterium]
MKNHIQILGIALFLLTAFNQASAACLVNTCAVQPRWELLGTRNVNFANDRDEIEVTAAEGMFTALKIKVLRSTMDMNKMVVHFGDGSTENIELKNMFRAGEESRVIDLPGNKRFIKKVVFWYDTKNYKKRRAVVELWGRH